MHSELLLLNRQILNFMNICKSKVTSNRLHSELIDCMEDTEASQFGSKSIRKQINSEGIRKQSDTRAKQIFQSCQEARLKDSAIQIDIVTYSWGEKDTVASYHIQRNILKEEQKKIHRHNCHPIPLAFRRSRARRL